jgi:hypothetical protein
MWSDPTQRPLSWFLFRLIGGLDALQNIGNDEGAAMRLIEREAMPLILNLIQIFDYEAVSCRPGSPTGLNLFN